MPLREPSPDGSRSPPSEPLGPDPCLPEGAFVEFNAAFLRIVTRSREELLPYCWEDSLVYPSVARVEPVVTQP